MSPLHSLEAFLINEYIWKFKFKCARSSGFNWLSWSLVNLLQMTDETLRVLIYCWFHCVLWSGFQSDQFGHTAVEDITFSQVNHFFGWLSIMGCHDYGSWMISQSPTLIVFSGRLGQGDRMNDSFIDRSVLTFTIPGKSVSCHVWSSNAISQQWYCCRTHLYYFQLKFIVRKGLVVCQNPESRGV